MQQLWDKINTYSKLTDEDKLAFGSILKKREYKKNEYFILNGQTPKVVGFVQQGLLSQFFTAENGDLVIKRFFPENYFAASVSAMLLNIPSQFTIKALEPCVLLEYNFQHFKELVASHPNIAAFYITYIERHWIIEKEPVEISYRYDTANTRYADFLKAYPTLEPRLKQHEIASYLGITPTQLSRVRASMNL